jgi:hypothetical protein
MYCTFKVLPLRIEPAGGPLLTLTVKWEGYEEPYFKLASTHLPADMLARAILNLVGYSTKVTARNGLARVSLILSPTSRVEDGFR